VTKSALLVVATVALFAFVAPGVARVSAGAPGWTELFVGRSSVGTVPGLVRPLGPDSANAQTPVPSPRTCIAQWNLEVSQQTRRWISSRGARQADVTVMTSYAQAVGSSKRYSISQCAFGIAIRRTALIAAVAPLPHSHSVWRGELLRYRTPATLQRLTQGFNARVTRTGLLRLG
jgi:hypothetical protein